MTALKTLSLRLRGAKVDLEEAGLETDGMAESTSRLRDQLLGLTGGKVDIMLDENTFKSTTDILREMSEVWSSLTDIESASALELMGGKQQANVLAAIIQNFDIIEDAIKTSADSAGSAIKENERYLDSIQGKIDQFNNALQTMWSHTLDDSLIKGFVSLGTGLIKIVDNVGLAETALAGFLTYLSVFKKENIDFAKILGLHDKNNGWIIGEEGFTKLLTELPNKLKNKFGKKNTIIPDILGDKQEVEISVKEFAESIQDNIEDYVTIDTSKIDEQIQSVQDRMQQLLQPAYQPSAELYGGRYVGNFPLFDDDAAEKAYMDDSIKLEEDRIEQLKESYAELDELLKQRDELKSKAATDYAQNFLDSTRIQKDVGAAKQEIQSLLSALSQIDGVELSLGNEQEAAAKIDLVNQAAQQGQGALMQYASSLDDTDIALKAYIASVDDGQYSIAGFNKFVKTHNKGLKESGLAAKAAAVGHAALNAVISLGITFLISKAISTVASVIKKNEELRESAITTANAFEEQNKQLKDYKTQIQQLRTELDSGNLSETEAYQIREKLISIQQELIDNFGLEAKGIDLVTGAINSQIESINQLSKDNAQAWLNENYKAINNAIDYLDENTHGVFGAGLSGNVFDVGITNWGVTSRVKNSVKTHAEERENATFMSAALTPESDLDFSGTADEIKAEIEHWLDWFKQEEQIINQEITDATVQNNKTLVASLQKDLAQTQDFIEDLSDSYKEYFGEDSTYTQNKRILEQAQQNTAITQYANQMSAIASAEQAYQEAIKSGNETAANEALEDINSAIETATNDASANGQQFMVEFFNGMKKGYQDANFKKNLSEDKGLNDKVTKALGNFDDTLELGNTAQHTKEQKEAYNVLTEVANEYGYEVEDLIKLLCTLGMIEATPTIELQSEDEKITDSLSKISALESAFNSLGDAVKEFKEDGTASAGTLEELNEVFGKLDGFEDLYKVLATGEGDVEEAVTKVANAYISQAGILSDVTDEELQIMAARLESLGVINAQELLQTRQKVQQELDAKLQGYDIDLSTYSTAEQAKAAIAQLMTNDILSAVAGMETQLSEQYGFNLSDFVSTEEAKVKAAKEAARKIAEANKNAALSSLNQEYLDKGYTLSELGRSEGYRNAKQEIFDEYNSIVGGIDAINTALTTSVGSIVDKYYNSVAKFDFSGNKTGIGRDYDEEIDDDNDDSDKDDALDKLRKKYENKISLLENQQTYLENEIERMEAEDEQVGKAVYEEQIRLEEQKIGLYEQERDALLAAMNSVEKGSDEWYEYANAVWETEHAIQDSTLAIVDFQQKITDLYVNVFDKIEETYGHLNDLRQYQQDYLNNEIEYAELTDQPISADYYKGLIEAQSKDYVEKLTEANALRQTLDLGLADGSIKEGTEEWADLQKRIYDANLEAQGARNTLEETNNEMKQLYVTAFEKVGEAYDALDSLYSDRRSYAEGYMELEELRGNPVQTGAYDYLIENETNSLNANLQKLADQEAKLQNAMANGIQKGSEEWIEMEAEIRATEAAIQDNYITLEQYNDELKNLYSEAFNKVRDSFSDVTYVYDDQQAFVESYIDYLETLGVSVPEEMYEKLGNIELEKQEANIKKLADMQEAFAKMEAEGYTPEDEEWVQAKADIRAVEKAIWDSEVAMAEYNKRVREMDTEKFEEYTKRIGDMVDELERLYNLFSDEDVATEDGAWTEEGIASLGLMYQKMEVAKKQIADYQKEIDKLNDEYKSGAISEQEYNDRLVELKNSQWDSIEAYEDAKDAIVDINEARVDMIEEGINKEIEAYEELIDLKRKELDAERDLYNFRKDIKDQTKDIAALERKIAAMSGSTDAATIAERTKLEQQLRDAQDALDDSYYNHAMDSQSTALDDENEAYVTSKEDYVEMLRDALEDVESIVTNTMSQVLINADTVLGELNGVSGEYGVTLSQSLMNPWISAAQQAETFKNSALMQEYEFAVQNGIFTGEITTDFSNLFGQTTTMATEFQTSMYTVMEGVRITVNTATSSMTTDMVMPFEKALGYAQETFSPQTIAELEAVATKAASLVYDETESLTSPWNDGTTAAHTYGDNAEEVLKKVYQAAQDYDPSQPISDHLNLAQGKYDLFGAHVEDVFEGMAADAEKRAREIGKEMSDIIDAAQSAQNAINNTGGSENGKKDSGGGTTTLPKSSYQSEPPKNQHSNTAPPASDVKALQHCLNMLFSAGLTLDGKLGDKTKKAIKNAQKTMYNYGFESMKSQDGLYGAATRKAMINYIDSKINSLKQQSGSSMIGQAVQRYEGIKSRLPKAFYAKGTTGTKRDELAITDEIGDELVLIPGKGGNLQYMRKGTAVIPADISANLMEWGKLNPNMDMSGAVQGVNLMTNVISKPEVNLSFDALVKAEHITEETLPAVKKLVTEELEKFSRNLNYSLKRVGAK